MLSIINLSVSGSTEFGQEILKGINLSIAPGTIHVLMGPNGSGKSTLAYALMGHPRYHVVSGTVMFNGVDMSTLAPDKRARAGLFLTFQQPYAIPGVTVFALLKAAHEAVSGVVTSVADFSVLLQHALTMVGLDASYADRAVHDRFSGGESKRLELAQMLILKPTLVIFDEIDSGLDVDGLRCVADCIAYLKKENPLLSVLCITHYPRLLDYVVPDYVHVIKHGVIVQSGDGRLARQIGVAGYAQVSP